MARDTGDKSMKTVLCDPEILLGTERVSGSIKHLLEDATELTDKILGSMCGSKLKSIPPEEAVAICRAVGERVAPELIGQVIRQLIDMRLQKML